MHTKKEKEEAKKEKKEEKEKNKQGKTEPQAGMSKYITYLPHLTKTFGYCRVLAL